MKTHFYFAAFFILASFSLPQSYAQQSPLSVEIRAGGSLSNMKMKYFDNKRKTGYQLGGFANYDFNNGLFLQSGISFVNKGAKINEDVLSYPIIVDQNTSSSELFNGKLKINYGMQYLQMPLMAGYRIKTNNSLLFRFSAGPYIGYGVGGNTTLKLNGTLGENNTPYLDKEKGKTFSDFAFRRFDWGMAIGVSAEFRRFLINLGYEHGLYKTIDRLDYRHRNATLSLGYRVY